MLLVSLQLSYEWNTWFDDENIWSVNSANAMEMSLIMHLQH